ncbi:MAG: polymerase subunit beta, partial [Paenibacillus sp.]|nr:polymerase subunit beta [Paenibacillus sp.]
MRAAVPQSFLSEALQRVARAVPSHSAIPILYGIHLRLHRDGITLVASNSVMTIRTDLCRSDTGVATAPLPDDGPSLVVPARYFIDIVRKLTPAPVLLELEDRKTLT